MSIIVTTKQEASPSRPTWWCARFDGRWDISGASFSGHGQGHLLLLMFSQGSLYCLRMDVCTDTKQKTFLSVELAFAFDSTQQLNKNNENSSNNNTKMPNFLNNCFLNNVMIERVVSAPKQWL